MKTMKVMAMALAVGLMAGACSQDEEKSTANDQPAKLRFNLTDAPAGYDAVNIDIREVRVHIDGSTDSNNNGWNTVNFNPGIYNLLDFQNGIDTIIGEGEVPPGRLSQIRLILGPEVNNSVVIDGTTYPLKTPSGQQSGLKLNVQYDLEPGLYYEFWLDFDAQRSIVEKGNGDYSLKPVIRVFTQATSGAIEGFVDPVASKPSVLAYNTAGDSAMSMADTATGYFLIGGLGAGTYMVDFDPVSPYTPVSEPNINVVVGQRTNMDTVSIP